MSHYKSYRVSDRWGGGGVVFRSIDRLSACVRKGRCLCLEAILPVATLVAHAALEAFFGTLDVQLRRRVRDAEPESLNVAVSHVLVLDAYDKTDRRSDLPQAQRSPHYGQPALAAASIDPPCGVNSHHALKDHNGVWGK